MMESFCFAVGLIAFRRFAGTAWVDRVGIGGRDGLVEFLDQLLEFFAMNRVAVVDAPGFGHVFWYAVMTPRWVH